ncbi:50S ribosomal protein L21e [Candidatus Woesearchaeota archaeon]|jgi:large subunit ribosomal protein L21e|nr:50S ribosomal protein L21e [Candidatus Woesearchaeota archaeon]MBT4368324.1 50S ribosomal protein L21e [Candidatus Woesearchaeota archaeon]MBT4712813.1 50S ribosomal protein L21e [Candidatus Woesearchaeota archaeon]MBT6639725.1 50S ribosomal protein L21e [Candidatus Woesearchaeota archaeon]MBT7133897.1 50S ribosomal protein L21e [Candidatus Woesearchaeota archaeon]
MARNKGTFRTKTRYKMKKERREKGKISISRFFQVFKLGEKVHLCVEPAVQKGMYFPRFLGKTGEIVGKKKICYEVKIKDGNKEKILVSHPVHLKKCIPK